MLSLPEIATYRTDAVRFTDVSSQYSSLARSLIRLASGQALPPPSLDHAVLGPDAAGDADEGGAERQRRRAREWCLQNEQGGYTFKEEDEGGLSLAKAVQAAGEAMAGVAGLYEEQVSTVASSLESGRGTDAFTGGLAGSDTSPAGPGAAARSSLPALAKRSESGY